MTSGEFPYSVTVVLPLFYFDSEIISWLFHQLGVNEWMFDSSLRDFEWAMRFRHSRDLTVFMLKSAPEVFDLNYCSDHLDKPNSK